ncbi:MAG: diguanylate cyclase [Dehalococcoidia bacterium]
MPRKTTTTKPKQAKTAKDDLAATMMASLLPVHSAITLEWLVDAAATAAERGLNAPFAFVYFEDQDGRLSRKLPASDVRRRSLERAVDAFGGAIATRLDPADLPPFAEALDAGAPVTKTPAAFFAGQIDLAAATAAQNALGVQHVTAVPLETAGERIGALLLLLPHQADPRHVRLLADHIACATVNLRQAEAARENGVIDVVRSVFDARKLESELQRELTRADRYQREVSVVVIEATNLRLLREQFGGFLADRLLQQLGENLAQHARGIDIIGAYKESGYTMILTEAPPEGAATAARRLLQRACETRLDGEPVPGLELHMLAGWATSPTDGRTSDALFTAAETRMYSPDNQVRVA